MTAPAIAAARLAPTAARQRNLTPHTSAAQPRSQGRPTTPEPSATPHAAALDGPAKRSYTPTNHRRAAAPERWVEKVARSIKGSDTPHPTGPATGRFPRSLPIG